MFSKSFVVGLALASFTEALSIAETNPFIKRATSPDNTCGDVANGDNNGFSCDPAVNVGGCCSQFGFCGATVDYCGEGCQANFSTSCTGSTDTCGATGDNQVCAEGLCCSVNGFCGNTSDYCGTGCQQDFTPGACDNVTSTPPPTGGGGGGDTFLCGADNGNMSCDPGLCCSQFGFCGNTTDYCGDGCQTDFGNCTGPGSVGEDEFCGPSNGGAICSNDACCGPAGTCGTSEDFCEDPAVCQPGYGRCDSDATPAGPSTINDPRPKLGSVTYTADILDCIEDNVVALSYDDGPYLYTSQLLDILNATGFHATFFITGNNNGKGEIDITDPYPSLIQRMIADGHQVASHTWSHYSLQNITSAQRIQQMVKNEMAFNNIIGKYPTYMRPPYSECDAASGCQTDLENLGYHRIYFDLDTQDYLNPLPTEIQASKDIVEQALQVKGVTDYLSIQHDIVQQSVTNLTSYYYGLIQAKGWRGVTVGECLGDPEANWYRTSPAS